MLAHPCWLFLDYRQCYAILIAAKGADASNWGEVWNTMVDIEGMCVRNGMHGVASFGEYVRAAFGIWRLMCAFFGCRNA